MNKTAGYDDPCYGQDPYDEKQEQIDLANDRELERVTHEIITNLRRSGIDKEHDVSMLDVFDDMVLTGIDTNCQDAMIRSLYILYRHRRTLSPLINKHIDYVARIAAEHELEKS